MRNASQICMTPFLFFVTPRIWCFVPVHAHTLYFLIPQPAPETPVMIRLTACPARIKIVDQEILVTDQHGQVRVDVQLDSTLSGTTAHIFRSCMGR
jgi:hypothetical protein